jgi:hypothetical protein
MKVWRLGHDFQSGNSDIVVPRNSAAGTILKAPTLDTDLARSFESVLSLQNGFRIILAFTADSFKVSHNITSRK